MLLARGDTNGAKAALGQASLHAKSFSELERAKLGMLQANLGGTRAVRIDALSRLVAAVPTDVQALDSLAKSLENNDLAYWNLYLATPAHTQRILEKFQVRMGLIAPKLGAQKLGYNLSIIAPGKPMQNAFIESFNGRLGMNC